MTPDRVYLLCGGGSRRMGKDKALIQINGKTLLNRQISKARTVFDEVVLLSGPNRYDSDCRQIGDVISDAGPLSGLLAALKDNKAASSQTAILPVDLPNISKKTLYKLSNKTLKKRTDTLILRSSSSIQPLAGIYKTSIAPRIEAYLENGERAVLSFLSRLKTEYINVPDTELHNLNRLDDLFKL